VDSVEVIENQKSGEAWQHLHSVPFFLQWLFSNRSVLTTCFSRTELSTSLLSWRRPHLERRNDVRGLFVLYDPTSSSTLPVCALDADITILSADGVLFKVHRKNLEVHSDVFAGAEDATRPENGDEIVHLPENSDVLDLLFQYMYRQPQPDLNKVEFATIAGLAEAAEKYVVYSALEWCRMRMKLVFIFSYFANICLFDAEKLSRPIRWRFLVTLQDITMSISLTSPPSRVWVIESLKLSQYSHYLYSTTGCDSS
jgi:hypothetical protein